MMSPTLWADIPHKNRTALRDFGGYHALAHVAIYETVARAGFPYQVYPLGDGIGTPGWQDVHQREHVNANRALGIAGPALLADYDFEDRVAFATWMFIHSQEHLRLHAAAGII